MRASPWKRFYKDVRTVPADGAFQIHLDDKALQSPARAMLSLPNANLADAIAGEWQAQDTNIVPESMPLTKLAFTGVDRIAPYREAVVDQIAAYANADVVCYRAAEPSELVMRQNDAWDAVVEWARDAHGLIVRTGSGIGFVAQEEATVAALTEMISGESDFFLAALHALTENAGSLVLALAVAEGRFPPADAFRRAYCDELYQMDKWGADREAEERFAKRAEEFEHAARFVSLLGRSPRIRRPAALDA